MNRNVLRHFARARGRDSHTRDPPIPPSLRQPQTGLRVRKTTPLMVYDDRHAGGGSTWRGVARSDGKTVIGASL